MIGLGPIVAGLVLVFSVGAVAGWLLSRRRSTEDGDPDLAHIEDADDLKDELVQLRNEREQLRNENHRLEEQADELRDRAEQIKHLDPPQISGARFGTLGVLYTLYRHHVRRRRLAKKGYVQWFRVENGTLTGPHYVRPEKDGRSPFFEAEADGATYFFPDDAMVPEPRSGMWTVIHREGQSDPINLRDADEDAIPAEAVKEWSQMSVTSSPPGLLDRLDLDPQTLLMGGIAVTIVISALGKVL